MRKIVAGCLIVAGLGIVALGVWMLGLGSEASAKAAVDDSYNAQAQLEQSVGVPLDSSQTASIADAAAQPQRNQVFTVVGTGALIVGGGTVIFGIVLASEKIAATEPAPFQSPPTGTPPPAADRKPCPHCGESISVLAHVCRFCQHDLDSDSV